MSALLALYPQHVHQAKSNASYSYIQELHNLALTNKQCPPITPGLKREQNNATAMHVGISNGMCVVYLLCLGCGTLIKMNGRHTWQIWMKRAQSPTLVGDQNNRGMCLKPLEQTSCQCCDETGSLKGWQQLQYLQLPIIPL